MSEKPIFRRRAIITSLVFVGFRVRDDFLLEILVPVVAKHQKKVRVEGLNLIFHHPEGLDQPFTVFCIGRNPLVLTKYNASFSWPVAGIFSYAQETLAAAPSPFRRAENVPLQEESAAANGWVPYPMCFSQLASCPLDWDLAVRV